MLKIKKMRSAISFLLSICLVITLTPLFILKTDECVYAAEDYFRVDGSKNYSITQFIDWAEDSDRRKESVHKVELLRDCKLSEWHQDDIFLKAKIDFDLKGHTLSGENDDHLFDVGKKGPDTIIIKNGTVKNFGDYDQDGSVIGIYRNEVSVKFQNLKIFGCHADSGAAVYSGKPNANVTLENTEIYDNITDDDGGAFYLRGGGAEISMKNSVLHHNHTAGDGGAICIGYSTEGKINKITGSNAVLHNNSCDKSGGAIYLNGEKEGKGGILSDLKLNNNSAKRDGGAIYSAKENYEFNALEIRNNTAKRGGGMFIYNDCNSLYNITITGNKASESGHGVYVDSDVDVDFLIGGVSVIADNNGNKADSNVYMSDNNPIDSHVNPTRLLKGSNVHIGYKKPVNNLLVTKQCIMLDTNYITCDNPGYHFYNKVYRDHQYHEYTGDLYMLRDTSSDSIMKYNLEQLKKFEKVVNNCKKIKGIKLLYSKDKNFKKGVTKKYFKNYKTASSYIKEKLINTYYIKLSIY